MTPPHGLDEILSTFGDPHALDFEAKNIVSFTLPYALVFNTAMVQKSRCHRLMVSTFTDVFQALLDEGLEDHASHYSGIYAQRPIRGFSHFPSTHSWGIAIDLNAEENPLGGTSSQDERVVAVFKDHGFTWGGDFKARKDPMHFQWCSGY